MLGRDDNRRDLDGHAALIANRDLGLAIGAQVGERAVLAHAGQALGKALGKVNGHGHERGGLAHGVAEHHALVAGADKVERVGRSVGNLGLDLEALVDALGDVGRLAVNGREHAAGVAVEAVLGTVVADVLEHAASDGLDVHVSLGANFTGHKNDARGGEALASATHAREVGLLAGGRDIAGSFKARLGLQDGVEHGVGNLVADFVGMALGHALGGEEEVTVLVQGHVEPLNGLGNDAGAGASPCAC